MREAKKKWSFLFFFEIYDAAWSHFHDHRQTALSVEFNSLFFILSGRGISFLCDLTVLRKLSFFDRTFEVKKSSVTVSCPVFRSPTPEIRLNIIPPFPQLMILHLKLLGKAKSHFVAFCQLFCFLILLTTFFIMS